VLGSEEVRNSVHGEAVARGEIHAELGQIRGAKHAIGIGALRKFLHDVQIVFTFMREKKPGLVADQGPGKSATWCPIVEVDALDVLQGGNKVHKGIAETVVAVTALKSSQAA